MNKTWKLSPSDLTFLWEECPRCYYLKIARKFSRPSQPMPKIFSRIDLIMKGYFAGKDTSWISPDLPAGTVRFGEKWVTSEPLHLLGHQDACYLRGRFDSVMEFDDGSYGIVDFKTTQAKASHVDLYSRQLQAYAFALENPAPGSFALRPVTCLGLLCVEPARMEPAEFGQVAYFSNMTWIECPRNDRLFMDFLGGVLDLLEQPHPPSASPECLFCKYRAEAQENLL